MAAGLGRENHDHQKNNAACCFAIYQTVCMSGNRYFSRIVGVVSLCKRDPSDFFLISRVDKDFKKTLFVQVWVLRLPHTMMSACSRLTALPAQFARGRTASLTARTAKFTAQVRQHNVHGPLLFFPSPVAKTFHVMPAATEDRNLSCCSERQNAQKQLPVFLS
jgi:hypothetical protein